MSLSEEDLISALSSVLLTPDGEEIFDGVDSDLVSYLAGALSEGYNLSDLAAAGPDSPAAEVLAPFLESSGCDEDAIGSAVRAVNDAASKKIASSNSKNRSSDGWGPARTSGGGGGGGDNGDDEDGGGGGGARRLKQGVMSMSSDLGSRTEAEVDAERFMWGKDSGVAAYTNELKDAHRDKSSAKDKRKARQELERARREYESKMRAMQEQEEGEAGMASVSAMVLPDYRSGRNEKDIQVRNVAIGLDNGRQLLDNAELRFAYRRRYGLVGKNGVGKTTLLKAIASMEIEGFPRHHRVLHVRQELRAAGGDVSVIQAVLEADAERNALIKREKQLLAQLEGSGGVGAAADGEGGSVEDKRKKLRERKEALQNSVDHPSASTFDEDLKSLDEVYARLSVLSSDTAESRAATILSGLQFTPAMQTGPTSALSGGWRMRVALAAALFIEPDLLLLDEPTNHLDLEAVLWLESYLVEYKHTLVVVSHDRGFLNEVCTDIIEFKKQKLTYYKGDYDTYVRTAEENVKNAMRQYQAYQDKRAHMMEFIDKFRANAKRATMVQSRIKTVEKMDAEAPEPVEVEQVWRFSIPNPEPLGRPIVSIDDASFDYNAAAGGEGGTKLAREKYLLQDVNFGIDLESRIGILGPNGAGKSTLLNLIMGRLNPVSGSISRNGRLRVGYFTQHSADKFDLQLSAVENMLQLFEDAGDQQMRSFVGRFQIQGSEALKPMMMLSGGQKSRIAFAALAYQKPHVIVFDEPTNHLDMESIDALVEAVKDFRGGIVVVSHDQYFVTNTCRELWVVGEGRATRFRGDFNEYKKHTLERTAKRVAESVKSLSSINN